MKFILTGLNYTSVIWEIVAIKSIQCSQGVLDPLRGRADLCREHV